MLKDNRNEKKKKNLKVTSKVPRASLKSVLEYKLKN